MSTCINKKTVKEYLSFLAERRKLGPAWWLSMLAKDDVLITLTYNFCNDPNSVIDREWIEKELKKTEAYKKAKEGVYNDSYLLEAASLEHEEKLKEAALKNLTDNMIGSVIVCAQKCAKLINESEQMLLTPFEIFKIKILIGEIKY